MSRMITSIFMIGSIGYFVYRFRYRILSILLVSSWMRRLAVGSIMNIPAVKRNLIKSVFRRPSER